MVRTVHSRCVAIVGAGLGLHLVTADLWIPDRLGGVLLVRLLGLLVGLRGRGVDLHVGLAHIHVGDADQPGRVVDLWGHVEDDAAGMGHAHRERVGEVIGRRLARCLAA
jgi:hypothetical protein